MPDAEKDVATLARCQGVGTPAHNVTRAQRGYRLPVVGDCRTCGQQVELTREWTTKYHKTYVLPPAKPEATS